MVGLNTVIGSSINPFDVGTLSVCTISGGNAINVVPGFAEMSGMTRCVEPEVKLTMREKIKSVSESIAQAYGGHAEVEFVEGFPSVDNDPELTERCIKAFKKALNSDDDVVIMDRPKLATEDFAYYQERVPGVYFMLGCRHKGKESGTLHSDILNVNEGSFKYGLRAYGNIILDFCGR